MLLGKEAHADARVHREATALVDAGYRVEVVGLTYRAPTPTFRHEGGFTITHVRHEGLVRGPLKRALAKVAPRAGDALRRTARRVRGLPERRDAPTDRPATAEELRADRFATLVAHVRTARSRALTLASAAIARRPRVVHAHDLDTLLAASWAARATRAELVYDAHEIFWAQHPPGDAPAIWVDYYRDLEAKLIDQADAMITVGDRAARVFAETYGIAAPLVVRNSIPLGAPPKARATGDPVQALYHGGLSADRGLEQLIDAAASFQGVELLLRGDGPLQPSLQSRVAELGLEDRVRFEAAVPPNEVVPAAARSDIGLIPYLPGCLNHEVSTPNKIFEYLSAGVAIAASDLPELRAIVEDSEAGALFDATDPASIAATVNALAADRGALDRHRRAARAAAEDRHHWTVDAMKLVAMYQRLTR